jgi:transposase
MFIDVFKNNGTEYLRLAASRRITNQKGVKVTSKKIILNLGPVSRFDDGKPDYLKRLKQSFKDGHPLIPELTAYVENSAPEPEIYNIQFKQGEQTCISTPKHLASCILDAAFSGLGLDEFFASIKFSSKIKYDLQGIVKLLTYERLLNPSSKIAAMNQNDSYFTPLVKSPNNDNVYDALDVIYENRKKIFKRINTCISRNIGRNTSNIYYDVTNFFFETEEPDDDIADSDGNVIDKGLRKMGVSKENRKQPIVQMGLFLDDNGIPISIEMFPGNTLDHLTLRTAMKNTINDLELDRFILVADRGMYSGTNMCHVINNGNGYIVSKSLKKSKGADRRWVLEQDDYVSEGSDFKYKSRIDEVICTDEDGSKRKIKQNVVVYWSRKFYERERYENKRFIDFIEKLKSNPNGFRVSAAQSKCLKKYIKKEMVNKKTGEVVDSKELLSMIDEEKLKEFNELMGYYQIVSSELGMSEKEIIEKYHGLTRIEDQFREMKGTLETRPIYVWTPEHVKAHLILCFIALTIMRVLQRKIQKSLPENSDKDKYWSYGLTGGKLTKTLYDWNADKLPGDYYRMIHPESEELKKVLKAFEVNLEYKLFSISELKNLKKNVKIL